LLAAAAPLAIWHEPPIWFRWISPDAGPKPPQDSAFGLSIQIGSSEGGPGLTIGRRDLAAEQAEYERAKAQYERRRSQVWTVRAASAAIAVAGLALNIWGCIRGTEPSIARAAVALSAIALTWDFVLLGIAVAVAIFAFGSFAVG
jgi:hypothetical protein